MLVWQIVWTCLFRPSPRPLSGWRRFLLRCFGCQIEGRPTVLSTARIKMPWQLVLGEGSCLGDGCEVYNLGRVTLKPHATVTQQVYLCGGTHDLSQPDSPLMVGDIVIGEQAFVGVRALVLPGVTIGDGAVIGAGAVVTKDMPEWMICAGNPCRPIKAREFAGR
jgi:putative colanic acid biosynthesis acetyltransferase WcaF